ncbi:hypothetical protein ACO1O0_004316 [Amphichorda felina]
MAPTPKKSGDGSPDQPQPLTESELRFIKAVFDNMTQRPDADWSAVANSLTLKDAKCAKERWRQMSVRHGWRDGGSTASPRKGGASSFSSSSSGGVVDSDSKITKKTRTPRKKAKKEDDDQVKSEDADDADLKGEI